MSFNEETLRQLLESPYGPSCVNAFLDAVEAGKTMEIKTETKGVVVITKRAQAESALQELYGWRERCRPEGHERGK